jgi:hypothetical protein
MYRINYYNGEGNLLQRENILIILKFYKFEFRLLNPKARVLLLINKAININ